MKHKQVKQSEYYKAETDGVKRLKRICDRCGDGTFMAEHNDRWYCGKCSMTVWKKKDEKKDEKKQVDRPKLVQKPEPVEKSKIEEKTDAAT